MEAESGAIQSWYPRVVVLGPGGVKGLLLLGFLFPLEDNGFLDRTDIYCGVSVGALIALLKVSGYKVREIVGEAATLDLFKDVGSLAIPDIISQRGLISNEQIKRRLQQLMISKFGSVPTLHGLYMRTGKMFVSTTLNTTDERCEMMGPFTHPHVSCVDATMFSMNIPFLFYQLVYQGKVYVDGALGNPYPMDYFDDGNTDVLGIYLKSDHSGGASFAPTHPPQILEPVMQPQEAKSVGMYALKMVESIMEQRRNHIIQMTSDRCKHVCLKSTTKDTTGYTVTIEEKGEMLVAGFNRGREFLDQVANNTYTGPPIPAHAQFSYPPHEHQ
jgi:predicted acylesterase/phospholipase RssA